MAAVGDVGMEVTSWDGGCDVQVKHEITFGCNESKIMHVRMASARKECSIPHGSSVLVQDQALSSIVEVGFGCLGDIIFAWK